ncbi:MAG: RNA polymerase factor sigma-54 [Myxococcales bacterium]|nr:RNA polymerase factor sigma-54 [Myxococcales bacterium]
MLELRQNLNQSLKQQLQLKMTPQLQQAIRLLQLNRMELVDAIHAEIEQNPALEDDARLERSEIEQEAALNGERPRLEEHSEPDKAREVSGDADAAGEIDWQQWLDQYNSSPPTTSIRRDAAEDIPNLEQTLSATVTLQEHLEHQVGELQMYDDDREIALQIIGALDERGYLTGERPTEDIAIALDRSVDHVERVLNTIQRLDPVGVAARCLTECLLVQLEVRGGKEPLAAKLVTKYLPELEKRNFQAIARTEEIEVDEIIAALGVIRSLDPRPARNFGGENSVYITPDIYVYKIGDDYEIVLNEDGLPKLRIAGYYKNALQNGINRDARKYVKEKLDSARWLISSIHRRQQTIYKVVESILKFQRDFFDKGIDHLKPLILRDVAQDIDMHESTVSRVTSNKYVHTPRGIFELKYFFSSSVGSASGGDDVASASVKHRIRQLIEAENPKRPMSDQAIVKALEKDDIKIARRTVAKYREAMGILSSQKRRKIM